MLDASDDKKKLERVIAEMPIIHQEKVHSMYKEKKIRDGEIFQIIHKGFWKAGIFVKGKLCTVDYDEGLFAPQRLAVLRRRGVAKLLDIAETKWIPTARYPWIPQRYVNVESGKSLYAAKANEGQFDDARHDTNVIDPEFHAN